MSLVGKKFPNLSVNAMDEMGDTFQLNILEEAQKNKKKVLLFWYPKDFTFVCPTELHAFQKAAEEFDIPLKKFVQYTKMVKTFPQF